MSASPNAELLAKIEEALQIADDLEAHEVAIWLDRARVAAGGSGEIDPYRIEMALPAGH